MKIELENYLIRSKGNTKHVATNYLHVSKLHKFLYFNYMESHYKNAPLPIFTFIQINDKHLNSMLV